MYRRLVILVILYMLVRSFEGAPVRDRRSVRSADNDLSSIVQHPCASSSGLVGFTGTPIAQSTVAKIESQLRTAALLTRQKADARLLTPMIEEWFRKSRPVYDIAWWRDAVQPNVDYFNDISITVHRSPADANLWTVDAYHDTAHKFKSKDISKGLLNTMFELYQKMQLNMYRYAANIYQFIITERNHSRIYLPPPCATPFADNLLNLLKTEMKQMMCHIERLIEASQNLTQLTSAVSQDIRDVLAIQYKPTEKVDRHRRTASLVLETFIEDFLRSMIQLLRPSRSHK